MPPKLRSFLKKLKDAYHLPRRIAVEAKQIKSEFLLDRKRYSKFSTPKDTLYHTATRQFEFQTQVDRDVHRVEKGLALRSPKRPFGKDLKTRLEFLRVKVAKHDPTSAQTITRALEDLNSWNNGDTASEVSAPEYTKYILPTDFDLDDFFWGRKSLRVFSDCPIDRNLITKAVDLARNTPSVCNRQSWRVYAVDAPDLLGKVLPLQNGNESFRSEIKMALIITSDLQKFSRAGERNQVWIDGGLFSMSLAWALHGLGLGTCMLNWSVNNSQSELVRSAVNISQSEEIIMFMAVGHPEEGTRYARSEKKPTAELLFWPES